MQNQTKLGFIIVFSLALLVLEGAAHQANGTSTSQSNTERAPTIKFIKFVRHFGAPTLLFQVSWPNVFNTYLKVPTVESKLD